MNDVESNGNKRALLIGVDKYPKLALRYQLGGCVNDVEAMADILGGKFAFPDSNMALLRDGEATRDGILAALDELVDSAETDDIVVIHYSGHGSQMTDREGDEPDGMDETIVPCDAGRGPGSDRIPDITDDEIYLRLLSLTAKTPHVTLIFDCCHSGSISRDPFGANSRWVEPDVRPAEELPPSPVPQEMHTQMREARRDVGPSAWLPLGGRYVLIAGCRDEESSFEHVGEAAPSEEPVLHGALTYFLCRELVDAQPGTTYRDVFESASALVSARYPRQHPQMEGARDREVFGVRDIEPMRFVPVRERQGSKAILGAGAAHGVTTGSQWEIYPQATKRITRDTVNVGTVEIDTVRAVTADATILAQEKGVIAQGSRAVEVVHQYGEMRLTVEISPAPAGHERAASELATMIEASPLLRLGDTGEITDNRMYIVSPRTRVENDDPVPQLGAVDRPVWAAIGQDGQLTMPVHRVDEPGVAATLCANLERWSQYDNALALTNPDERSLLKNKVELTLLRQTRSGTWEEAVPDDAGGQIVFEEGDRIAFRIAYNGDASMLSKIFGKPDVPIFVSVLDFGLTGAVSPLYPFEGANEHLIAGKTIEYGIRRGEEIDLYMPDGFPDEQRGQGQNLSGGIETFKLFATTHEADFSWLHQPGVRGFGTPTRGVTSPLEQLLGMALTGNGTRDVRRRVLSVDEDWTTDQRSFLLKRRGV